MTKEFKLQKVVTKLTLEEASDPRRDLKYWLSRPSSERIAAVEYLRKQYYGDAGRIQKVVRIVKMEKQERG